MKIRQIYSFVFIFNYSNKNFNKPYRHSKESGKNKFYFVLISPYFDRIQRDFFNTVIRNIEFIIEIEIIYNLCAIGNAAPFSS